MSDQSVELILGRSPVTLISFPNEAKPLQRDTGHINWFDPDGQTVNRSSMSQNEFYKANVDAESHRTGTLGGSITAKSNEPFAIESRDTALPEMPLEHIEGCGLGAARGLAYIAHVVDMKVDEFAERFQARYTGLCRRLTTIDLALGIGCPASCVISAQEGLAGVAPFAADLDTPRAE